MFNLFFNIYALIYCKWVFHLYTDKSNASKQICKIFIEG